MNKWILAFFILIIGITSCRKQKDTFKLAGRIENPASNQVALYLDRNILDTLLLSPVGSFEKEIPLKKQELLQLVQGKQRLNFYGVPNHHSQEYN